MMGGGMSAYLKGAASHTTKLLESFVHNLNRLEAITLTAELNVLRRTLPSSGLTTQKRRRTRLKAGASKELNKQL
jgi:hypothetical protein